MPPPPGPFVPSGPSPASPGAPQVWEGLTGSTVQLQRTGVLTMPGQRQANPGGREGISIQGPGGVAHAPPYPPASPIGPENSDSRAEQEGNRSRARRPRLSAVQLPLLPPLRLSKRLSACSMSGLRVYSTSVTGSREVSTPLSLRSAQPFPGAPGSRPHHGGGAGWGA